MRWLRLVGIVVISVTAGTGASAADWYRTEGTSCSGVQALGDAISAVTGGGIRIEAGDGPGNFFAPLKASDLSAVLAARERVSNQVDLDRDKATTFRRLFLSNADSSKVPAFVSTGTSILTGLALPARLGTAAGLLFSYFFSQVDAAAAEVRDVGLFFAEGGQIYRRVAVLKRAADENIFLSATTEYKVALGIESRTFVVHGCVYPIRVDAIEFQTTGPANNKIFKNTSGTTWKTWDIEDQRFEGDDYKFVRQEGGFYYLERPAIENDRVVGQDLHRFSFLGGPWQRMRYDQRPNGSWGTLYEVINAR